MPRWGQVCICRGGYIQASGGLRKLKMVETLILVERMGDDHVALGSDFDGALMPLPVRDASHLPNLIQALRAHGFDDATLRKIAFDNWMRVFRQSWR